MNIKTKKDTSCKFYCYICGNKIGDYFYIVSMRPDTDRVFLVCSSKCKTQIDDKDLVAYAVCK